MVGVYMNLGQWCRNTADPNTVAPSMQCEAAFALCQRTRRTSPFTSLRSPQGTHNMIKLIITYFGIAFTSREECDFFFLKDHSTRQALAVTVSDT